MMNNKNDEQKSNRYEFERHVSEEIFEERRRIVTEAWERLKGKGIPLPKEAYDIIYMGMENPDK